MIAGEGPFFKLIALATLSSSLPGANTYMQKKIESLFLKNTCGASLKEIDEPWLEKNDLSFDEILYILENEHDYLYETNPAQCSKQATFIHAPLKIMTLRDFTSSLINSIGKSDTQY